MNLYKFQMCIFTEVSFYLLKNNLEQNLLYPSP